jgi:hypothetical protein
MDMVVRCFSPFHPAQRRGIILHLLPRVPKYLSLRPNRLPLPPLPQPSVSPPHGIKGGGGNTRLRVRGGANSNDWRLEKAWQSVHPVLRCMRNFNITNFLFRPRLTRRCLSFRVFVTYSFSALNALGVVS